MTKATRPRGTKRVFRFLRRSTDDVRADVREEFAFHLEMRVEDLQREGLSEAAARAQALREFGSVDRGTEGCVREGVTLERRRSATRLATELRQDIKFGLRLIARNPAFSFVAIVTLAVAIGGNAAIFSVINALALKPLPVSHPERIARVYSGESQMSWLNYQDLRARSTTFDDIAAHASAMRGLTRGDNTIRAIGEVASTNYLTMLGVPPRLGRTFTPTDTRADVIVLSERTWRTRYASDANIIGQWITLDTVQYEVLGVMPAGFRGVRPPGLMAEFWLPVDPAPANRALGDRKKPAFEVVGRLKDGINVGAAQAEMAVLATRLKAEYALADHFTAMEVFTVDGLEGYRGMANAMLPIFLFVGLMTIVSGLVLLVGCANIAGLLLGRGAARRREIAVRLALGAGRGRLIRQLLAESLVLAAIGGSVGILLALWLGTTLNLLAARLPFPIEFDLTADRWMFTYTFGVALATCLLCGLTPARRATRLEVVPALKDDDPAATRQRFRQALVVGQVMLSCLLLLWSGLFLRSLLNVHRIEPGFDPSGVVLASIVADDEPQASSLANELLPRVRALPGVQSAALASVVPLSFTGREEHRVHPDTVASDARGPWVMHNRLTPGWFDTLRIPIIAGRDFQSSDGAGTPRVTVVNETAARLFWNGQAVGRRVDDMEVVGVVRDTKYWTLGETVMPLVYTPFAQDPIRELNLNVRTSDVAGTTTALRAELRRLAPTLFVELKPLTTAIAVSILPAQVGAVLTGAFGALAAMLAMMGVYGLVSLMVAQRTREIGIRKAIGAGTIDVVRLVVRGSVTLVTVGLTLGTLLGVLGARALGGFIVGVSPMDPLTISVTAMLVIGTAVLASAVPALRAARVDPLRTLRSE
jgi:putative ABC transport system permease protein